MIAALRARRAKGAATLRKIDRALAGHQRAVLSYLSLIFLFMTGAGAPVFGGPSPSGGAATAFLAQAAVSETSLATWLWTAFAAIGAMSGAVIGWRILIGKPEETRRQHVSGGPVTIRGEVEFVAKPEFMELTTDVERVERDMDDMERRLNLRLDTSVRELNSERKTDIAGLHKKIEDHDHRNQGRFEMILEKIGELRGGKKQ